MELTLQREPTANSRTFGVLSVDGQRQCWTLEDEVRAPGVKVLGETAILAGRYEVVINHSPRFKRKLPLLLHVPGFDGIRIHAGNTPLDTEGCILVGDGRSETAILYSKNAFNDLFQMLCLAVEPIFITIMDAPEVAP